jgi:nitrate reductase (cytochrome), electron transfer subunit
MTDPKTPNEEQPLLRERFGSPTALLVGVAVAVAAVAFVARTGDHAKPAGYAEQRDVAETATRAPSNLQLTNTRWGPNAGLYETLVPGLALSADVPAELSDPQPPEHRTQALAQRKQNRAYDGAPPVIPHAIAQQGAPSCLACHGSGATAAGRMAPMMSHAPLQNCPQCHVVAESPKPLFVSLEPANSFVGLRHQGGGARAWPVAPPVIPHPTFMRERCLSCHGNSGWAGLRTPHQNRSNCQQCHAPSGVLDQRPITVSQVSP